VVVDEAPPLDFVEGRVFRFVEAAHEEHFEDVLFDEEEDDEDDGQDQHAKGGQVGELGYGDGLDVVVASVWGPEGARQRCLL